MSPSESVEANKSIELSQSEASEANTSSDLNPFNRNDIGFYINKKCTDEEIYRLMKNRWFPSENYSFPINEYRNLKFQRKWLSEFYWLSYSIKDDGAYCHFCVFFCIEEVGRGSHMKPKNLVSSPLKNWKKAKEQLYHHENLDCHKKAIVFGQNFINLRDKQIPNISLQLDKSRKLEIETNRKIVASIIETIIFIGRQDIACRGRRDADVIIIENPDENDGNFRSLLRFRMSSGEPQLAIRG